MNNWKSVPVSHVADIYLGGTPKRSEASYWNGGIPWASAKDIANSPSRYLLDTEETISVLGLNNSAAKLLERDTILITARGTVGAISMLGRPMAFNQTNYGLIAKQKIVDPTFLYYALKMSFDSIQSLTYGTIFDTITMKSFDALNIPLPPLAEQRRIAHILGTLDDKIELNRRMNSTLEAIARALFKSWFVDFDPVRAKAAGRLPPEIETLFPNSFVDSELGEIPEGWELKGLDQIADFLNGLALQKYPPETIRESLPVIKIREMRQGYSAATDRASSDIDSKYIIEDGDLLFSWSGSLFTKFWAEGRGALNQHLFKVTSKHYPAWFYYLWLQQHMPQFQEIAAGKATTMGHIQRHHLSAAKCLVPPKKLIQELSEIMLPLIGTHVSNQIEARKLSEIRNTLLPRLIEIGL
ncbi:MAG TPA: restriction endonuclease subunit S [Anaerolineales bacterium]|nr:restriction endonuclease subunit S [Anaerolineales bacterium]HRQ93368.1 restriction endonuclease subunit S [Anaerolineales bacterium]